MSYFEKLDPEMDEYLENHGSKEPEILAKLRKETYQKILNPHMLSGYQQGRLLTILSKIIAPKNILEIGTFTGYATLCLAEGLAADGKIITLDVNEDIAYLPQKYFEESSYSSQIDFKIGNALDFVRKNKEIFDLVFIDADKENYVEYFNLLKPNIKSGGVLLFDNVLWYGKVLEENPDLESTRNIKELNAMIANDTDFENVILPLRDGLSIVRKR
ncbi:O-methyltransferase [Frigoriflavimonas asaccharolytica]|uniref:Putative O-methyltransferase YrrM n=1 Tax=Frigoriflavimonas asaccharolytica TaxID=2735899 RepID=A0A8J8GCI5_9FLAO|nr:O-methyltransferase [Frigoriflavimonas asaccharolytica]NRS93445.1 putative O-methyltransferase YrrM [Frigoriflavimonas asaccharolytica]